MIIQLCLEIYDLWTHSPPLGRCMVGWMGGWVGSCQINKNWINCHLIKRFVFCLNTYDLFRCPHLWVGVWVVEWMGGLLCGSVGGVLSNHLILNKS